MSNHDDFPLVLVCIWLLYNFVAVTVNLNTGSVMLSNIL